MHEIEHEPDPTIFERRDPLIGQALAGRFRLDARLAAGGFGAIYLAVDLRSGREVALKVLHANLTADPLIVARFRREGATLASLRDPHTVTAYELGEAPDGTLYIVMELLRGETLYDAYRRHGGPLPWRRVAAIARAVCSSLAEAHARGIVHRDLKPANIHLQERDGQRDFVKVLDFGIAKILGGSDLDPSELTIVGQMIGTFDYMAPEQMLGGVVGAPCDLYTLGVVMYEMITGRLPFAGATSPTHLLATLLTTTPPPLASRTPVPPALDRIVMRCLEREPQDRYPSAAELARELGDVLDGRGREEPATEVDGRAPGCEEPTRIVPRGATTRLTPARGAELRAALAPAHPVEAIGDVRAQGSQPVIAPVRRAAPVDAYDATIPVGRAHPRPARGSQPCVAPGGSRPLLPAYAQPQPPSPSPPPSPPPHSPYPAAYPPYVDPRAPLAISDGRGSRPYVDPRATPPAIAPAGAPWPQLHHAPRRGAGGAAFDAARDAAVRRIVWALVLALGGVLAVVVANLL